MDPCSTAMPPELSQNPLSSGENASECFPAIQHESPRKRQKIGHPHTDSADDGAPEHAPEQPKLESEPVVASESGVMEGIEGDARDVSEDGEDGVNLEQKTPIPSQSSVASENVSFSGNMQVVSTSDDGKEGATTSKIPDDSNQNQVNENGGVNEIVQSQEHKQEAADEGKGDEKEKIPDNDIDVTEDPIEQVEAKVKVSGRRTRKMKLAAAATAIPRTPTKGKGEAPATVIRQSPRAPKPKRMGSDFISLQHPIILHSSTSTSSSTAKKPLLSLSSASTSSFPLAHAELAVDALDVDSKSRMGKREKSMPVSASIPKSRGTSKGRGKGRPPKPKSAKSNQNGDSNNTKHADFLPPLPFYSSCRSAILKWGIIDWDRLEFISKSASGDSLFPVGFTSLVIQRPHMAGFEGEDWLYTCTIEEKKVNGRPTPTFVVVCNNTGMRFESTSMTSVWDLVGNEQIKAGNRSKGAKYSGTDLYGYSAIKVCLIGIRDGVACEPSRARSAPVDVLVNGVKGFMGGSVGMGKVKVKGVQIDSKGKGKSKRSDDDDVDFVVDGKGGGRGRRKGAPAEEVIPLREKSRRARSQVSHTYATIDDDVEGESEGEGGDVENSDSLDISVEIPVTRSTKTTSAPAAAAAPTALGRLAASTIDIDNDSDSDTSAASLCSKCTGGSDSCWECRVLREIKENDSDICDSDSDDEPAWKDQTRLAIIPWVDRIDGTSARTRGYSKITYEQKERWRVRMLIPPLPPRPKNIPSKFLNMSDEKKYAQLQIHVMGGLKIIMGKSFIHGYGMFARTMIHEGEFVIEYVGELIRNIVADIRERQYDDRGIPCYMFRIAPDLIIDATMAGNKARLINHSCEPNCESRTINVGGQKHIVIQAKRDIARMEEITYDYMFNFEEEQSKVPCYCRAKNCRGFMN